MRKVIILAVISVLFVGCSGNKPKPDWTATQYFTYAKSLFEDEDYFEASNEFSVIVLRYAGSFVADSAQYYLGECHYHMDEYIIAAAEFEKLINNMNRSPLVPLAQYKLAESYFQISPRPALDQEYSEKAIREYQNFIEDYPTHALKTEAEKKIALLREKLAFKQYINAENYMKMREYQAALIYFDVVLEKYYDTAYADDALMGKILVYNELKDFNAAKDEYIKFRQIFPQSNLLPKVEKLFASLPTEYQTLEE